jgi:hypothetical protein
MSKEENALVPVDFTQLPATQRGDDEEFGELAKGGDFLGRLQLYSKGKAIDKGLVKPGTWGIPESDEDIVDLGDSIDCLVLARRPKALDMSDKEAIVVNYDMKSDEFQRIADAAGGTDSGCMFGPSFLVVERSTGRMLEYFCGTKSTRSEAKKIYAFLPLTEQQIADRGLDCEPHGPLPFTMGCRLVEKGRFSWHVPVVKKCSTPFTKMPTMAAAAKEIERFLNPPEEGVEKVQEKEGSKKRAR